MSSGRHHRPRLLGTVAAAVLSAITAAGCVPTGGGADKAGGAADPVVLRLANTSSDPSTGLERHPALQYFVDQVKDLSDGALRIEVASGWGGQLLPNAEQQVIADVAAGEVDLGWVGTSVFDTIGDTDFQALTAPMLIDSYPLQQAVLDSDIPAQMLAGLDEFGVHGIAVLADGLRKPIAAARPLLRPADYEGITFPAFRSREHAAAIRALGATPTDVGVDAGRASRRHDRRVREGPAHLRRKRLQLSRPVRHRQRQPVAPHPGADRQPRHAGRPDRERNGNWLTSAAFKRRVALHRSHRRRPRLLLRLCEEGARFADASASDLDRDAASSCRFPSTTTMNRDPTTKIFVERIKALKEATDPGPGLDIPADCTGSAAVTPTRGVGSRQRRCRRVWRRRWMARTGGRSRRLMRSLTNRGARGRMSWRPSRGSSR